MRGWVWLYGGEKDLAPADIKIFVRYQNNKPDGMMERSDGIQNVSYGIVNAGAFRAMASRNRIVIVHELLHILSASDKYNLEKRTAYSAGRPCQPLKKALVHATPR